MDSDGVTGVSAARSLATLEERPEDARRGEVVAAPDAQRRASPAQALAGKEEIVARLFEAFRERDLTGILALIHPDIHFQPVTATVTQAGRPYCGHEGMRRYVEDVEAHWEELTIRLAQIRSAGEAVVALGMVSGRGAAGSFEHAPTTWVLKFREGLVAHVQIFSDVRNAEEALGMGSG